MKFNSDYLYKYWIEESIKDASITKHGSLTILVKPKLLSSMLDFESTDSKLAGSLSKKSLDFSDNLAEEKVLTFSSGSFFSIREGSLSKKSLDFSDNLAEEKVKTFSSGSFSNANDEVILNKLLEKITIIN